MGWRCRNWGVGRGWGDWGGSGDWGVGEGATHPASNPVIRPRMARCARPAVAVLVLVFPRARIFKFQPTGTGQAGALEDNTRTSHRPDAPRLHARDSIPTTSMLSSCINNDIQTDCERASIGRKRCNKPPNVILRHVQQLSNSAIIYQEARRSSQSHASLHILFYIARQFSPVNSISVHI